MKRIVAVALAFVLGITLGLLLPLSPRSSTQSSNNIASSKFRTGVIVPALQIKVYDSDGTLIKSYTKVGDLPTVNFLKWLMYSWWSDRTSIQITNVTWTSEDGYTGQPANGIHGADAEMVAGVSDISLKVVLGNGTTPPTINDNALENKLDEAPVTWYYFDANSTHMWIEVKATYTATSPINITEVGLAGFMNYGYSSTHKWYLLFRDVISQISLDVDQTLEIRYYVYVRYG